MNTIAFFNNKGGVGKTTLLYHVAWMLSELGVRVVVLDLDPQSNVTSMFLSEDRLDELWEGPASGHSIVSAVAPLLEEGTGDVKQPHLEIVAKRLALVPGDLGLARLEDELSSQWPNCLAGKAKAFRITSAFHRVIRLAASEFKADVALLDVGPNLGAINRSAIIAANHVLVPLVPDLFSLQGLQNLGPTLQDWRKGWSKRLEEAPAGLEDLPQGKMQPVGYVVLQHAVKMSRPVKAYLRWAQRIPSEYRRAMQLPPAPEAMSPENDPNCLAQLKHYRSLMPLAMEAGKPIFHLTPRDGAIGAHVQAVADCGEDFRQLSLRLANVTNIHIPTGQPSS
jgi:cellulose biosynthesis protein BcsQ